MKYFLLLAVVIVFIWHWRSNRRAGIVQKKQRKAQHSPMSSTQTVDMVRCAHCQLHLAAADSVAGDKGRYCSREHRALAEK